MRKLTSFSTVLCLALAAVAPAGAQNVPGNSVVPFNLPDLGGTYHNPGQYKGRALVLWFFGYN
jgi:hypothetical protein